MCTLLHGVQFQLKLNPFPPVLDCALPKMTFHFTTFFFNFRFALLSLKNYIKWENNYQKVNYKLPSFYALPKKSILQITLNKKLKLKMKKNEYCEHMCKTVLKSKYTTQETFHKIQFSKFICLNVHSIQHMEVCIMHCIFP